jgi:hypothetical protein
MSETFDDFGEYVEGGEEKPQLDYESIFNRMQHSEPSHKLSKF